MRATSAAAAAPNSSTIGGAGTGAGEPLDEPVEPPDELVDPLDEVEPLEEPVEPLEVVPLLDDDDVLVLKP